jgi:lysine/ornithine N-monooxygenase
MNEHMTDYEYILQQARKAHYSNWNDEELRKCVDMLIGLTHEQLFSLYTSKWLNGDKVMMEEVFKCMYRDKIGKREERIKNLSTDELIEEFKDKKSGNVSLIRNEMKSRYKENNGDDRIKITMAFKESSTGDQSWVEHQERKEMYVTDKR